MQQSYDTLIEKWAPVLDEGVAQLPTIIVVQVTAAILENQETRNRQKTRQAAMHGFLTENAPAPGQQQVQ
jgi:hypothetical protein